jgi:prevent-host-death family protein
MITAPLNQVKDSLSDFVNRACSEQVLVTRHGRPAAILIGFADEDAWLDYRMEHDDRFVQRMAESRAQAASGQWRTLDSIEAELQSESTSQ